MCCDWYSAYSALWKVAVVIRGTSSGTAYVIGNGKCVVCGV